MIRTKLTKYTEMSEDGKMYEFRLHFEGNNYHFISETRFIIYIFPKNYKCSVTCKGHGTVQQWHLLWPMVNTTI